MRKTISLGLVAILAFAGGALAAMTTVSVANATLPGMSRSPGDADGDRIPDALERELCSRSATREQLVIEGAGRCKTALDYIAPGERHLVPLYLAIVPGIDADKDLLPSKVTLTSTLVTIDPFQTEASIVRFSPATETIEVPLDTHDADPDQPAQAIVTSPTAVPLGVEIGKDTDLDLLPGSMSLKWGHVKIDRTNVRAPLTFIAGTEQLVPVDEDDKNPDVPAQNRIDVSVPMSAAHSGDGDNDLIPGAVSVAMDSYRFDRRPGFLDLTYVGRSTTTKVVDENDDNRDNVVGLSAIDADVDFIPDAVEEIVCAVQSEVSAQDGKCVRADGTGEDGSGKNFVAPIGVRNPWSFQPGG